MENIQLEVSGNRFFEALQVAPDHTFSLERREAALKENATVMPNRKAGTMTWRAEIRTPGLPPDTRRLGDLRLECEVGMQARLISNYRPSLLGWINGLLPDGMAKMLGSPTLSATSFNGTLGSASGSITVR